MYSLITIRKFISEVDPRKQMQTNNGLMNINLISFAGEAIIYLVVFVMSVYYQDVLDM